MGNLEKYNENPCGTLSIPHWKSKHIRVPDNMRIVHDREYVCDDFQGYHDELYFRLFHPLKEVWTETLDGISILRLRRRIS